MKNTIYWYQIDQIGEDYFSRIAKVIKKRVFENTDRIGFKINSISSSEICADFIVREELEESIEDPFGNIITSKRVIFDISSVKINRGAPIIEVFNPGHKIKLFFNLLIDSIDNAVQFTQLKPNYSKLIESLEKSFKDFEVLELDTGSFLINNRTNCSLSFTSLVDVREDVNHFLKKRDFVVKKMRIHFTDKSLEFTIDVYGSGKHVLNFDTRLPEHQKTRELLLKSLEHE